MGKRTCVDCGKVVLVNRYKGGETTYRCGKCLKKAQKPVKTEKEDGEKVGK